MAPAQTPNPPSSLSGDNAPQVRRTSLRDAVVRRLEEAILSGELKADQRLNEVDVAQWLGVSRGVVREAIRELENTGIVINIPYRGTFVRSWTPERVRELYSVRSLLEEYAVEQAVAHITEAELEELETILRQMRWKASLGNAMDLVEMDLQFHKKIYACCRNSLLYDLLDNLSGQTHLFIMATKAVYSIFSSLEDAADSHQPILDALRAHDAEEARWQTHQHIFQVGERLIERLQGTDQLQTA